jgi:ABC-type Fe3+-siderophore transport system permease subunit
LKVLPVRINTGNIFQPLLAALPIIPVALFFDRVMEHNLSYVLVTVATSAVLYAGIMTTVFKNEQANRILRVIIGKIRKGK